MPFYSLKFKEFLLEMETTPQEKDALRTIVTKLIANDKPWLIANNILVGDKGGYWILNYDLKGHNEFNKLTRGLVIQKPTGQFNDPLELIKSFPFTRFFNKHEQPADPVDLSNADMLEKLDGSMVGVFFPTNDPKNPVWHTRKMVSAHQPDMDLKITGFHGTTGKLLPIIGSYVKKLPFTKEDISMTYVFEFIHEMSHVWTKYAPSDYGLKLIGARELTTHKEPTEQELDSIAKRLGVGRPRRWDSVADLKTIDQMMKQMAKEVDGFEGYVFRDRKTGKRIKLKDEDYIKFHHMIDELRYKNLVIKVLEGDADEILAYFPNVKEKVDKILIKHEEFVDKIVQKIQKWQAQKLSRLELVNKLFGRKGQKWDVRTNGPTTNIAPEEPNAFARSMILANVNKENTAELRQSVDKSVRQIALGQGTNKGQPKDYLRMVGVYEDDDDDDTNLEA
jgi:hypothetical protein